MMSITAHPLAHTRGLPPKVVPWVPGVMTDAISSVVMMAPMGIPAASPFAVVMMSGTMP